MFHKLGIRNQLDYPVELFINKSPKISIVEQANIVIDNYIGPETGSSVSFSKIESLVKAASEAVERRCSMLGASNDKNPEDYIETWELINSTKGSIKQKHTRLLHGSTDTTATAVHSNSQIAICNALKELFEKNSLFLFWYGFVGNKVPLNYFEKNEYYIFLKQSGFNTIVFINDFFKPLLTVIIIAYKENDQFICGLGTNTSFEKAIKHAFEEAFLIGYMHYYASLFGIKPDENGWSSPEKIKHVKNLQELEYAEIESYVSCDITVNSLLSNLPAFISELHLVYIEQSLNPSLKCVRVYSKDLINCLPLKNSIDLSSSINQNTIRLNKIILKELPECPMS